MCVAAMPVDAQIATLWEKSEPKSAFSWPMMLFSRNDFPVPGKGVHRNESMLAGVFLCALFNR